MEASPILKGSQLLQKSRENEPFTPVRNRSVKESLKEHQEKVIKKEESLSKDEAIKLIEGLNDFLSPVDTQLKFEFHDKLDEYYVTLINPETKEVVKEIPPKKLLDVYAAMAEQLGFIVDEKV
ncbi:flagellar protein FlaG [Filobacillus milosensis]|uniref:Flagellar protein FlaG n=1 Tax=Filobacillus milosensis TaxID=94137 RepID=A0A4Y8IRH3_9BACI|nr:flagellar protein FlaG [Filobacillus milosensis]TFB24373.1 flagellar protein FlaG [Filobacillus milosensis]